MQQCSTVSSDVSMFFIEVMISDVTCESASYKSLILFIVANSGRSDQLEEAKDMISAKKLNNLNARNSHKLFGLGKSKVVFSFSSRF